MNYIPKPSLEHIALVKVTTELWNQHDIRALIANFSFPIIGIEKLERWQKIELGVIEKVLKLPQPKHLQDKILGLIKPIGLQIAKWVEYHCNEESYFALDLPNSFTWTPQGTIDAKKTAEILIKNENIDISKCFKLACYYCLQTDIQEIWKKMSKNCKTSFFKVEHPIFVDSFASLNINDRKRNLASTGRRFNYRAFESAVNYHYTKAAVEYFFQKLTTSEKEECIVEIAENVANQRKKYPIDTECTEVLCFLLSQMDADQQIEVFKRSSFSVLKCLLDWPWQGFFLETTNRMWNFLPGDDFDCALREIINSITKGYTDFNYRKIFQELWQQSPETHKRYVTDKHSVSALLLKLFHIKDEKNFKMIIQHASVMAKKKFIFSIRGQYLCDEMINCEEWGLLKFVIQECIPSKKEIRQFKKEFKANLAMRCLKNDRLENEEGCDKFFHLLHDFVCSHKRKCNKGTDSYSAKKLCRIKCEKDIVE